jgi:hypothetical protein
VHRNKSPGWRVNATHGHAIQRVGSHRERTRNRRASDADNLLTVSLSVTSTVHGSDQKNIGFSAVHRRRTPVTRQNEGYKPISSRKKKRLESEHEPGEKLLKTGRLEQLVCAYLHPSRSGTYPKFDYSAIFGSISVIVQPTRGIKLGSYPLIHLFSIPTAQLHIVSAIFQDFTP